MSDLGIPPSAGSGAGCGGWGGAPSPDPRAKAPVQTGKDVTGQAVDTAIEKTLDGFVKGIFGR